MVNTVEMELSFFKISREDGHPCLDWAKDLTVRTADILHIELVGPGVGGFRIHDGHSLA